MEGAAAGGGRGAQNQGMYTSVIFIRLNGSVAVAIRFTTVCTTGVCIVPRVLGLRACGGKGRRGE